MFIQNFLRNSPKKCPKIWVTKPLCNGIVYAKEEERVFSGMSALAVVDIQYISKGKWDHLGTYALMFLYFERIIEQTIQNKDYYNHGFAAKEQQRKYLLPLIEYQMQRNGSRNDRQEEDEKAMDDWGTSNEYLYALFEHFCDSKQEYINLTCIKDEIDGMNESIQNIFFKANHKGGDKCEINDNNLQFIFPHLKGYKNHLGNLVHFDV
eukprot:412023_1